MDRYTHDRWYSTWAVFLATDVDRERPILVVWEEEAARHLGGLMNEQARSSALNGHVLPLPAVK